MDERIIILSDLHLGRSDGVHSVEELDGLISPGATLVLNGDTAELHDPEYQSRAEDEYARLQEIAATRGALLRILAGNHDPFLSRERLLELAEGTVIVTHGDSFHPAIAPWSESAKVMREAWERSMQAQAPARRGTLAAIFDATRDAAVAEWLASGHGVRHSTIGTFAFHPLRAANVAWYWARFPSMAAAFAMRFAPEAAVVVVGHSHRAGMWTRGGRTVFNTGAFTWPGKPHAVILERIGEHARAGLWPIVGRFGRAACRYAFADAPVGSVALPHGITIPALKSPATSNFDGPLRPAPPSDAEPTASAARRAASSKS
jgi:predicted phosphodiesterase